MIRIARFLRGDTAAVIFLLIGTIAQAVHTYFIQEYSSRLESPYNEIQAGMIAMFFSFSLAIVTLRAGKSQQSGKKVVHYRRYATFLFIFEWLINSHYYTRSFIIERLADGSEVPMMDWYDWSVTMLISFTLPFMIRSYAGYIDVPDIHIKDEALLKGLKNGGMLVDVLENYLSTDKKKRTLKLKLHKDEDNT